MNARIEQLARRAHARREGGDGRRRRPVAHGRGAERLGIPALKVTDGPSGARGERWTGRAVGVVPVRHRARRDVEPRARARRSASASAARRGARARTCCSRRPSTSTATRSRAATSSATPRIRSSRRAWRSRTSPACSRPGVGCTVKHFVANDSEFERMTISSEVDERTLREISLVPFEAAVHEAGTWAVMAAYNRVQRHVLQRARRCSTTLLRDEWGFDGVVMSDWYGTHSTAPAANAGPRPRDARPAAVVRRHARRRGARGRGRRERRSTTRCGACSRCSNAPARSTTPSRGPSCRIDDPDRPRGRRGAPRPRASCCCRTTARRCRSRRRRSQHARGDRPERRRAR